MAVMGNTSGTSITDGGAIPSVGTWGALNYPSWSSGTPFVKMTAAGTFSLDTNTYASSSASTTVNGQTCTLGSTCTIPFQTNSSGNTSQAGINLLTSTANSVGLTVTPTNSATNAEKFEVTGTYSGGISSSQVTTGLGYTPANCTAGTSGSDCLTLTSGLVPTGNLPGVGGGTHVATAWQCPNIGLISNAALPTSGLPVMIGCRNPFGATVNITSIMCYADNGSASTTIAVTDGSGNNLLSASTCTCSNSGAGASCGLSGTYTTLGTGGYVKTTVVPDGTSKEVSVGITTTL